MTIKTDFYFERGDSDFKAKVEGRVTKHWNQLEVSDFTSDLELTRPEREAAESQLCEEACYHGHIPEEEPEARRYGF